MASLCSQARLQNPQQGLGSLMWPRPSHLSQLWLATFSLTHYAPATQMFHCLDPWLFHVSHTLVYSPNTLYTATPSLPLPEHPVKMAPPFLLFPPTVLTTFTHTHTHAHWPPYILTHVCFLKTVYSMTSTTSGMMSDLNNYLFKNWLTEWMTLAQRQSCAT